MTIAQPQRRRLQLGEVIGGSLVVVLAATASLAMLGSNYANKQISSEEATSPMKKKDDELPPILSRGGFLPFVQPLPPSSTPSLRPSSSPSESMQPSMLPSTNPSTSMQPSMPPSINPTTSPSITPSSHPSQSALPTQSTLPTSSIKPSSSTSPSSNPSSSPTSKPTIPNKFRLRLFWKQGYYWQESYDESWFCLACATCDNNLFSSACTLQEQCEEGMLLGLVGCEPGTNGKIKPVEFTVRRNLFDKRNRGDMVSVYQRDLCIARQQRDVTLQKCDSGDKYQRWTGFYPDREFELQPANMKPGKRCLTQHHHPKRGERIFAEHCEKARKAKTSLWVAY